jgi:hypothetical protein
VGFSPTILFRLPEIINKHSPFITIKELFKIKLRKTNGIKNGIFPKIVCEISQIILVDSAKRK